MTTKKPNLRTRFYNKSHVKGQNLMFIPEAQDLEEAVEILEEDRVVEQNIKILREQYSGRKKPKLPVVNIQKRRDLD